MKKFVIAVPYGQDRVDFASLLRLAKDVSVSRLGPQRRVQIEMEDARLEDVKKALPAHVVIEPVGTYTQSTTL